MILSAMNELSYYRIGYIMKNFVKISLTIIPIIIMIKCMIDLFKVVTNPDEAKNTPKTIARRFISGLIIYLLPVITDYSFKTLTNYNDDLIVKYYEGASIEKIKQYEILAEQEKKEEMSKKLALLKEAALKQAEAKAKLNGENSGKMDIYKKSKNARKNNQNQNNQDNQNNAANDNSYIPNDFSAEDFKVDAAEAKAILDRIPKEGIEMAQVAIFANGKVTSGDSYNSNNNTKYNISSASKTVLGITAAKMAEDGLINLDTNISTYWHNLGNINYNSCTSDWNSYVGSASTLKNYSQKNLVENPATIRNCLTHSSTIKT